MFGPPLFLIFKLCPPVGDVKLSMLFLYVICAKNHFQTLYMQWKMRQRKQYFLLVAYKM
jgi:hypothetical protein